MLVKVGEKITHGISDYFEITDKVQGFPFGHSLNEHEKIYIDPFNGKLVVDIDEKHNFVYDPSADWIVYTEYENGSRNRRYNRKRVNKITEMLNREDLHFQRSVHTTGIPSIEEIKKLVRTYKRLRTMYRNTKLREDND